MTTSTENFKTVNILSKALYDGEQTHAVDELWAVEQQDASTSAKGVVQLATTQEVTTGSDNTKAVTPAGLKVELGKKATPSLVTNSISTHNTDASAHSTLFAGKQNARTTVADTTSTTATIANVAGNTDYTFSQALTSLTVTAVASSMNEATITFTTGSSFTLTLPASGLTQLGSPVVPQANQKVVISFWNNFYLIGIANA